MRYYDLTLATPEGNILALGPSGFVASTTGLPTFSSRIPNTNGSGTVNNPAALNIEFDMPVAPYAVPQGFQSIRLWGIGIQQVWQGARLNPNPTAGVLGASFSLTAGMRPGLPLATAAAGQARVIAQGTVYQAFGNWQGVNQTLDIVVQPADLSPSGGISFQWLPGQTLSAALEAALGSAFPGYALNIQIASLVQSQSSVSRAAGYPSLSDLAAMIQSQSQLIGQAQTAGGDSYPGVSIVVVGKQINVFDGTQPQTPVSMAFQDLMGQPTWIGPNTVNWKTVLRGDIQVGRQVTFPAGLPSAYGLTTQAAAVPGAPSRNRTSFQGNFTVTEVHHFGNFRQPDGDSWTTAFSAIGNRV
jgi:hypothetical protein